MPVPESLRPFVVHRSTIPTRISVTVVGAGAPMAIHGTRLPRQLPAGNAEVVVHYSF